jgi:acid phosphatase type 7
MSLPNSQGVPKQSLISSALSLGILGVGLLNACGGGASTAAPNGNTASVPKVLIIAGDIAQCPSTGPVGSSAEKTATLVKALLTTHGAEAQVLTLGDNVYNVGSPKEFADCYEPTWGAFKSRTLPTPGNHDYGQPNAFGYFDYFGALAGVDRKGFYAKQFDNWSVVSINSNIAVDGSSEQMQWLKSGSFSKCKLAAWHHPLFTSAIRGSNKFMTAIWEQLDLAKFDMVFQGYEHHYERFTPKKSDGTLASGIRSFVVGTGGASLNGFSAPVEGSEIRIGSFGVVVLKLYDNRYEWEFIDPDNKVLDSGSANCRG